MLMRGLDFHTFLLESCRQKVVCYSGESATSCSRFGAVIGNERAIAYPNSRAAWNKGWRDGESSIMSLAFGRKKWTLLVEAS